MSNWFDAEREVLNRHDAANKVGRAVPLELPEDPHKQPPLLQRIFGALRRKPQAESTGEPDRKYVPRVGH